MFVKGCRFLRACVLFLGLTVLALPLLAMPNHVSDEHTLLIFAPHAEEEHYREQLALLQQEEEGLRRRDLLVWHVLCGSGNVTVWRSNTDERFAPLDIDSQDLAEQFSIMENKFRLILLGKDGTINLHLARPITAEELFILLDIEMRRANQRRQRSVRA